MNLADNIRRIRLERGMTQSALAEALGVSDRAVSRWETAASTPDVALLARLALLLETSTDALLGVDPQRMQADILQATADSTALLRASQPEQAVTLLREKSTLYPNQPELMVYLARALLALRTEAAAREALALCRAADGGNPAGSGSPAGGRSPTCSRPNLRLSTVFGCKQVMADALHRLGKSEQAAQLVEDEMPAIFVARELLLPKLVPPERAARIRRSNVTLLSGLLVSTLRKLGHAEAADSIQQTVAALPAPEA